MYLLLTNYSGNDWSVERVNTLEELRKLYDDAEFPPYALILAKELTLKICEPDESTVTDG